VPLRQGDRALFNTKSKASSTETWLHIVIDGSRSSCEARTASYLICEGITSGESS
jgi:hypothetical protein